MVSYHRDFLRMPGLEVAKLDPNIFSLPDLDFESIEASGRGARGIIDFSGNSEAAVMTGALKMAGFRHIIHETPGMRTNHIQCLNLVIFRAAKVDRPDR